MTSDRPLDRATPLADGRPMTDELVVVYRVRVQTRYYDLPEVVDTLARCLAVRAGSLG